MAGVPGYCIKSAETDDLEEVLVIMRENYYFEEMMFAALFTDAVVTEDEKKIIISNDDDSIRAAFKSSTCLIAVHEKSNKIVGAIITSLSKNPKFGSGASGLDSFLTSSEQQSPFNRDYYKYLRDLDKKADLFGKFPTADVMLEFYAIAIDKKHRRKGIASALMEGGIIFAKNRKIPIVFGVFTSQYSMKGAEKIGMKKIWSFDLLHYTDENGKKVFATSVPHNIVNVLVYETKHWK